jgi:hypothetical protein
MSVHKPNDLMSTWRAISRNKERGGDTILAELLFHVYGFVVHQRRCAESFHQFHAIERIVADCDSITKPITGNRFPSEQGEMARL